MRRRRRRGSAFRGPGVSPRTGMMVIGGAAAALVLAFVYLLNVADNLEPPRAEKRIDLPGVFKN